MKTCTTRKKKTAARKRARRRSREIITYWERPSIERPRGHRWSGYLNDLEDCDD